MSETKRTARTPTGKEYLALTLLPSDIIDNSHPIRPRVRKNPDGEWAYVGIKWVLRHNQYLVSITRADMRTSLWRVRVWLREEPLRLIMDEQGFHTVRGCEWAAYDALCVEAGIDSFNPGVQYRKRVARSMERRTGR